MTQVVSAADLEPGDVVTPAWTEDRSSPFDAALVEQVSEQAVTLFRPYATSNAFVYGEPPSVIALIGLERYAISRGSTALLFRRWSNTVAGTRATSPQP